jgi:hypothetical protein
VGKAVSVLSVTALLLLSGCAIMRQPCGQQAGREPGRPDLARVKKIEMHCGRCGGILGAPCVDYDLELRSGGPCRLTVTHSTNDKLSGGTKATYDLPAETFEECRRLLIGGAFFDKKDSRPRILFENSGSSISVTCDDRYKHSVSVTHPAPAPKGFDELFSLAEKAEERGKLVQRTPPSDSPPEPTPGGK